MELGVWGGAPENCGTLAVWRRNLRAPKTVFLHSRVGAQADKFHNSLYHTAAPLLAEIGSVSL